MKAITFRGGEREEPENKAEKGQGEAKMKKENLECIAPPEPRKKRRSG